MVVPPTARNVLAPTSDARLTLVTCYPFYYAGPAPERFIVQARLVEPSQAGFYNFLNSRSINLALPAVIAGAVILQGQANCPQLGRNRGWIDGIGVLTCFI